MRNVADKSCTENQNTHFVFSNFFSENRAVYEIMWKNMVQRGRPQMTIWRMRIACWITRAINTHSEYIILIDFHCNNGNANAPQFYIIRTLQPVLCGTRRFISVFTTAGHLFLSWARLFHSTYNPISWISILMLSSHLHLGLLWSFFPSGFRTRTLSHYPHVPHALPISFFIWSPEWYLLISTDHEVSLYAVFSSSLLSRPPYTYNSTACYGLVPI